jgi:hypothetical protein
VIVTRHDNNKVQQQQGARASRVQEQQGARIRKAQQQQGVTIARRDNNKVRKQVRCESKNQK